MLYSPQPRTLFPYSAVLLVFHSRDDEGKQFECCEWVEGCDGNIPSRIRIRIPANALLSLSLSLVLISLSPSRFTVFGFFFTTFPAVCSVFFPSPWTLIKDKLSFDRCRSSSRLASFFSSRFNYSGIGEKIFVKNNLSVYFCESHKFYESKNFVYFD